MPPIINTTVAPTGAADGEANMFPRNALARSPQPQQQTQQQPLPTLKPAGESERERYANDLLKEGTKTTPIQHWTQGAARLAQALVGGYMAGEAERRRGALAGEPSASAARSVAGAPPRSPVRMPYALPGNLFSNENIGTLNAAPSTQGSAVQFQRAADNPYGWPRFARSGAGAADPDAGKLDWEE
jgi:hypothetical protein